GFLVRCLCTHPIGSRSGGAGVCAYLLIVAQGGWCYMSLAKKFAERKGDPGEIAGFAMGAEPLKVSVASQKRLIARFCEASLNPISARSGRGRRPRAA